MDYRIYEVYNLLRPYVKCIWSLESFEINNDFAAQRIFPDGCCEIIFNYKEPFKRLLDNEIQVQPRSFVFGQLTTYLDIIPTGLIGVFGIRFYPYGLAAFTNFNLNEMADRYVSINEIWGKSGRILAERMLETSNNMKKAELINEFLISKLHLKLNFEKLNQSVVRMQSSKGLVNMALLANEVAMGNRQLRRQFISSIGLTPKMLARIIRFHNTLQLIKRAKFNSLTAVAYEGGFYDQAHFIKDFKDFTGMSPTQFFKEDFKLAALFSEEE